MKGILYSLFVATVFIFSCRSTSQVVSHPEDYASKVPVDTTKGTKDAMIKKVGETFEITLESNPTTGYMWEWSNNKDSTVVAKVSNKYEGSKPAIPGSGGVEVFTFKALKAGKATLKLQYKRSWEKGFIKEKKIHVIVKD